MLGYRLEPVLSSGIYERRAERAISMNCSLCAAWLACPLARDGQAEANDPATVADVYAALTIGAYAAKSDSTFEEDLCSAHADQYGSLKASVERRKTENGPSTH
jgi:hypothetical protein